MKWNKSIGYVIRVQAETVLKKYLGLSTLDYYVDEHEKFIPYYTYIMQYLNSRLVTLGDTDIRFRLDEIEKIYNYGAEKIAALASLDLVRTVGIETWYEGQEEDLEHERCLVHPEENEKHEEETGEKLPEPDCWNIPFDLERFVFAWGAFMTALWMRLKFQYSGYFKEEPNTDCCRCGGKGQTENDYEAWSSKVFPQDELFDRSIFEEDRTHTAWGIKDNKYYCDCYRKNDNVTQVFLKPEK